MFDVAHLILLFISGQLLFVGMVLPSSRFVATINKQVVATLSVCLIGLSLVLLWVALG